MITETIFIILLASMFIFLFLTHYFKSEVFGGCTIVLCLLVGSQLLPLIGGVQYQTGAVITDAGGGLTNVVNTYADFTNVPMAIIFFVMVFYLLQQAWSTRKGNKSEAEENNHI